MSCESSGCISVSCRLSSLKISQLSTSELLKFSFLEVLFSEVFTKFAGKSTFSITWFGSSKLIFNFISSTNAWYLVLLSWALISLLR